MAVSQAPEWWLEDQGPAYWLSQLFNTPVEVHTFELGVLVGGLFGVLVARQYPRAAVIACVVVVAFLFGVFEVPLLCSTRTEACAHVLYKPWYFLSGLLVVLVPVRAVS